MNEYYTSGTIGDTYIILCKLYRIAVEQKIVCKHFTSYNSLRPLIKEVYSLLPNITVEFIDTLKGVVDIRGNFRYLLSDSEIDVYKYRTELYPEFDLPSVSHFSLPEKYNVVQLTAGTKSRKKTLDDKVIKSMLMNNSNIPIVFVGESSTDVNIEGSIDLRGKTSIKEVINIIKHSQYFYGYQGFLSFVALSQKIKSNVYLGAPKDSAAIDTRIRCVDWKNFCKEIKLW